MKKLRVWVVCIAISLMMPIAFAGKPDKPGKPPKSEPATCIMQVVPQLPDGHGYISSGGQFVDVDLSIQSFGPPDQPLYIHENLLPPENADDPTGGIGLLYEGLGEPTNELYGPVFGLIRIMGNERVDYIFDTYQGCGDPMTGDRLCPFRLVVLDGTPIFTGKGKNKTLESVAFGGGRTLLDYRYWCGQDICQETIYGCFDDRDCPGVPYPEGYVLASFDVIFVDADSGGGEEPSGSENGGQCKDGKDNDGDGDIDCEDPDCSDIKWCL
jgi:hypothetical protein